MSTDPAATPHLATVLPGIDAMLHLLPGSEGELIGGSEHMRGVSATTSDGELSMPPPGDALAYFRPKASSRCPDWPSD